MRACTELTCTGRASRSQFRSVPITVLTIRTGGQSTSKQGAKKRQVSSGVANFRVDTSLFKRRRNGSISLRPISEAVNSRHRSLSGDAAGRGNEDFTAERERSKRRQVDEILNHTVLANLHRIGVVPPVEALRFIGEEECDSALLRRLDDFLRRDRNALGTAKLLIDAERSQHGLLGPFFR